MRLTWNRCWTVRRPGWLIPMWICSLASLAAAQESAEAPQVEAAEVDVQAQPYPTTAPAGAAVPPPVVPGQAVPAQLSPYQSPGIQPGQVPPGAATPPVAVGPDGQPIPGGQPAAGGQPGAAAAGEKPGMEVIRRAEDPDEPPDPLELQVRPNAAGKVNFQFRGQKWPDLVEWIGLVCGLSVDWQELPGDYVNIATHREYSIDETRDVINRHLLARGYTFLKDGELLTVVKAKEVSLGMVPRAQAADLDRLMAHDFVKVSLRLKSLLAEEMVKELEPLLSKNGRLFALKHTNRIEVVDAATNIRQIRDLIELEQSPSELSTLVREFVLQYARADDVKTQLEAFLSGGGGAAPAVPGMTPEQMAAMQQQQAMMAAQGVVVENMQGMQPGGVQAVAPGAAGPVQMLVNEQRNSLIVHAPPDKLPLIDQAIRLLDVADGRPQSLSAYLSGMQVYRLAELDPQKLADALQRLGGLDPRTRLEVDKQNNAIIAYASPADHYTIETMVEKLDGSGREIHVIQLRNLEADQVAGTIQYLLMESEEEGNQRNPFEAMFIFGMPRQRQPERPKNGFRIDADVINNRLILKVNPIELEAVLDLLVKLGELPQQGTNSRGTTRILDVAPGRETGQYLDRIRKQWEQLSPHPLVIPPALMPPPGSSEPLQPRRPRGPARDDTKTPDNRQPPAAPDDASEIPPANSPAESTEKAPAERPATDATARTVIPREVPPDSLPPQWVAQTREVPVSWTNRQITPAPPLQVPSASQNRAAGVTGFDPANPGSTPRAVDPITITQGPDGRLVIYSQNMAALDQLERLMLQTAPPRRAFEVFQLEYAPATWVVFNLKDFFKDDEKANDRQRDQFMSMWLGMPSQQRGSGEKVRLSRRPPPKFISDIDTNTILVKGASPDQLETIEQLIRLYDVQEPVNNQTARVTKLFYIKYSRASAVAATIKDAYRDLLSANDPALQQPGGQPQEAPSRSAGATYITNLGMDGGDGDERPDKTQVRFKGKLSMGIDDLTNTLLVSAEGDTLLSIVADMIKELDEAARPLSRMEVVRLRHGTDGARVQEVLTQLLAKPRQGGPPQQPGQPQPGMVPGQPYPAAQNPGVMQPVPTDVEVIQ